MDTINYNVVGLTADDVARVRPIVVEFQRLLGRRLVYPASSNADLNYGKKLANGENVLSRPIKMYRLETVDLLGVLPVKMEHTGEIMIEFNGNPKLRFPLVAPNFQSVSTVSIGEAIKKFEDKGEPTFYSDVEKAMAEVEAMNDSSIRMLDAFVTEFSQMGTMLRDVNKNMRESQVSYLRQLGASQDVEVTVTVQQA